ncbi:hypothetical protein EMIHUDRAFT_217317 [Emiliania huxleyi CCMP1516]|uniref:Glycerol-3-phosphate dehydrogenase [NAD(+)] n=2 Tax=Emiliania huxleyi TaxID=2903 RepID=A0A0D3IBF7_EMIH1|nr:hypothetical protein EMIHUDRAFT_217317 [Emiliania huxleyi CCMP1516]EOD08592.1 hypothetical protein EMIHUDRAFT_217317 [Emiliania huxleyi CCMP1516]|eukprot:XP_005761021.1 hypothetical protein EMIHUDRAFT_217317 [Emiliania huxleyi CCMP1516]
MPINSKLVHRVCVVGGGSWGTAVAKLVSENTERWPEFEPLVKLWVHDAALAATINEQHENTKYLPGVKMPDAVVAEADLSAALSLATLVIIAVPHEFLHGEIFRKILVGGAANCRVCSLVKGLDVVDGRPALVTERMRRDLLGLDVSVLMGANIAAEVAAGSFCEATLGVRTAEDGPVWQRVFNRPWFRVNVVMDATGVELCAALKPIAAIVRVGLEEMRRFSKLFFPHVRTATFFEACGVAEVVVSAYSGRTRRCAEAFAREVAAGGPAPNWAALELELLGDQKLPAMHRLREVMECVRAQGPRAQARFPLFSAIHAIAFHGAPPSRVLKLPERRIS